MTVKAPPPPTLFNSQLNETTQRRRTVDRSSCQHRYSYLRFYSDSVECGASGVSCRVSEKS